MGLFDEFEDPVQIILQVPEGHKGEYIVVHEGKVVQTIIAHIFDHAIAQQTERGMMYVKTGAQKGEA